MVSVPIISGPCFSVVPRSRIWLDVPSAVRICISGCSLYLISRFAACCVFLRRGNANIKFACSDAWRRWVPQAGGSDL
jgi:hypothetical protein